MANIEPWAMRTICRELQLLVTRRTSPPDCCTRAQLRIHDSERVDFYVMVASGPIIEDCTALRFAPSRLRYTAYEGQLQASSTQTKRPL